MLIRSDGFHQGVHNVSGGRLSIAAVMRLTAIIALNLGVIRFLADFFFFQFPPFLFLSVSLDLALVQAVVFGRPLRTFYFTFLVVGIFSTGVVTYLLLKSGIPLLSHSLPILETAIRHYRAFRGQSSVISPYTEFPMLAAAEQWLGCILALVPALAAAVLASWWMRRRGVRRSEPCPPGAAVDRSTGLLNSWGGGA